MSERRHEHRDPDRVALDELLRAFADDEPAAVPSDTVPSDTVPSDTVPSDTVPSDGEPAVRPDEAPPTRPVGARSDDGGGVDELREPTAGTDDHTDDHADAPVDAGADDRSDDRADAPIEELVIIEAESSGEAARPSVIRIDDLDPAVPPTTMIPPARRSWRSILRPRRAARAVPGARTRPTFDPRVLDDELAVDEPAVAVAPAVDVDRVAHVVIDDDDAPPDTVYVAGSLDRDGRSVVVIEDDDTGDTLAPESERDLRRGIEPRLRERRVAVKRAQGRRRLVRLLVVAGFLLVGVGVLAVLGSPLFAVDRDQVVVTGNVYTDAARLDEIVEDLVGTPVLRVDTQRIEAEIEAIPWVEDAEVRVDFPHAATIEIRERAAMATYQGPDGRFRVLDRSGRVLDVIENYPFAYVLLGGPDPVDLEPGEFAPRGYAAASELAKNLTSSIRGRVTMIEVTADGSRVVMHLDDGSTVFFGEATDLFVKLVRLETVLTSGVEREPGPIDVSTDDVTL